MIPYKPPRILFNKHLETIYPALLRKVDIQLAEPERIATPDDDFLDLDWYKQGAHKCLIISHGLEGNSSRAYVKGMAKVFLAAGFDVLAWNYRGCSGEPNRQLRFYHSGATDDLQFVVEHAAKKYGEIYLLGFSLGGNLTLKYLGEPVVHPAVKKAVVFSAPIDLHASCIQISRPSNWVYTKRFLNSLTNKVRTKAAVRDDLDIKGLSKMKTLFEFDDHFTGPIHGFKDAIDYYTKSSSIHYIKNIGIPTLVVNAANDPFLGPECYPTDEFSKHPHVIFEYPERGGHVGFALFNHNGLYWSEMRALSFIQGS
jgi:predicted alpha/beta-fold hydrolase